MPIRNEKRCNAPQFDLGHINNRQRAFNFDNAEATAEIECLCRLYDPSQTLVRFVKQVCASS